MNRIFSKLIYRLKYKKTYNSGESLNLIVAGFCLATTSLTAQDSPYKATNTHCLILKTQFAQFKDQFNYGLIFNGGAINLAYTFEQRKSSSILTYQGDLAFFLNSNKGLGVAVLIKPVDIYFGRKVKSKKLFLGPYAAAIYQWQLYPELQSGHMFWLSAWEIGPRIKFKVPYRSRSFNISFSNSLLGLSSRPLPGTESYYYSLKLSDFLQNAHQNIKFGTLNTYNHSTLQVEMHSNKYQRLSYSYEVEYFGYYQAPKISILLHSISFRWKLGKSGKS